MFLGIEIGGTKLQLGVGRGDGAPLVALERRDVVPARGAAGILRQIEAAAAPLIQRHGVRAIGCGFGGPVDRRMGRAIKSHQIEGWDGFPLAEWLARSFGLPAAVANDCDVASLAEAHFGAGRGQRVVFYVTVGTGIGGGLVLDGQIYSGSGTAAAEIGHLRPGISADSAEQTVESIASGWGIAAAAQARLAGPVTHQLKTLTAGERPADAESLRQRLIEVEEAAEEHAADLWQRCDGNLEQLTAQHVAQAAEQGNTLALEVLQHAVQTLGWAIAQVITLLAPQVVVIGGGVSLMSPSLFHAPLREQIARYVFPPLAGSFRVEPAELGEEVVVHGALALAAQAAG
jgi:glucokinase